MAPPDDLGLTAPPAAGPFILQSKKIGSDSISGKIESDPNWLTCSQRPAVDSIMARRGRPRRRLPESGRDVRAQSAARPVALRRGRNWPMGLVEMNARP